MDMKEFKRARTPEQREQRMEDIKAAADAMFSESPYHEITLTRIADRLGCSRTQIYKYAATKEEVFLELTEDKRGSYFEALLAAFPAGCSYPREVFAEVWAGILNAHRDFLRYSEMLMSIIETNVSVDRLAQFKRRYYDDLERILDMLSSNLGIGRDAAEGLYYSIYFQSIGLNTYCTGNPLVEEALRIADVRLARPDFRETMRDFILMCLDRYC